jgi:hypothetical protein
MSEETVPPIITSTRGDVQVVMTFKGGLSEGAASIAADPKNWWVVEDEGRKAGQKIHPAKAEVQSDGRLLLTFAEDLRNRRLHHSKAIPG